MQEEFWNKRYENAEYAYGKTPNSFLAQNSFNEKSKVLCLAEGEGRNAVFLAKKGLDVTAVDLSSEGIAKTLRLAKEENVTVDAICADLSSYAFASEKWDVIVLIFAHFPPALRIAIHSELFDTLKSGGKVILEAYSKEQINYKTGGPTELSMLYAEEELRHDFKSFDILTIQTLEREVNEGKFHHGLASVIQLVATKS